MHFGLEFGNDIARRRSSSETQIRNEMRAEEKRSCSEEMDSLYSAGAPWERAIVVVDSGAAALLQSHGAMRTLLEWRALAVCSVRQLRPTVLAGLERNAGMALSRSKDEPSRVVLFVTDELRLYTKEIQSLLQCDFANKWVQLKVLSALSAKDQNLSDFTGFALEMQQAAKQNSVELSVQHLQWNLQTLVDWKRNPRWGAFTVANDRVKSIYPATLARIGMFDSKENIDDVDGRKDFSDEYRARLKLSAQLLARSLWEELELDVRPSTWACGYTSRVVGNVLLDFTKELPAKSAQKEACLLLFDRSCDVASALIKTEAPILDKMFAVENTPDDFDDDYGPTSCFQSHKCDEILRKLTHTRSAKETYDIFSNAFPSIKRSDSVHGIESFLKAELDNEKLVAECDLLRIFRKAELDSKDNVAKSINSVDKILAAALQDSSSLFFPLIDLMNRGVENEQELKRLALLACARLGSTNTRRSSDNVEALFQETLQRSGPKNSNHIKKVLRETMSTEKHRRYHVSLMADTLFCSVRGKSPGGHSWERLGSSAFEKTAEDLEDQARNLLKQGIRAFGFSSGSRSKDKERKAAQFPRISANQVCVVFVFGGFCFNEIEETLRALSNEPNAPREIIFGGTSVATAEKVVEAAFQMPSEKSGAKNFAKGLF